MTRRQRRTLFRRSNLSGGRPLHTNNRSLETPRPDSHVVQLHDANEKMLPSNAVNYVVEGLKLGGGAVVIATPAHKSAFLQEIARAGIDTDSAAKCGRLEFLDAKTTLARIIVGGHPDGERFERVVGTPLREAKTISGEKGLRAYGEMVGLLWKAKQFPAAIRLEQLWNKLRVTVAFDLFCAYPIDVFDKDFDAGIVDALLCAHTHLLPSADASLQGALDRAIAEIHGSGTSMAESRISKKLRQDWAALPEPESTILWLRANLPDQADEILARARTYYQASA
jgi:hypothetical protein